MDLKTNADDKRAGRLALWIREMDLADQVFITGATLVFEDIRIRRDDLPVHYDEAHLREGTPSDVYARAVRLAQSYADQPPRSDEEGVDELRRISILAQEIAARVAKYHPDVLGSSQ